MTTEKRRNLEKPFIIPIVLLNKNCDERWMSHADNMTDSQSLFFSRSFLVIYFHFTLYACDLWHILYLLILSSYLFYLILLQEMIELCSEEALLDDPFSTGNMLNFK